MKISDFKIPCNIVKMACIANKVAFIDLQVTISNQTSSLQNGVLNASNTNGSSSIYWSIVNTCLENFQGIYGIPAFSSQEQKSKTLAAIHSFLGKLFIHERPQNWMIQNNTMQKLYQYALVWIIMNDLICVINKKPIKNINIVVGKQQSIDISKYINAQQLGQHKKQVFKDGIILLSSDIAYQPIAMAFLLWSAIQSIGLSPQQVINGIMNDKFLLQKLTGIAKVYFINERMQSDFISTLQTIGGCKNDIQSIMAQKTAQANPQAVLNMSRMQGTSSTQALMGNFWYAGIIQKMLEPARQSHPQVYFSLQNLRKVIWDKVIQARKQAGRQGLSYEALNQLKNKLKKTKQDYAVLQKLLSSKRIW